MSETLETDVAPAASAEGTQLRKNAIGLPEVLFQSITAMAPAAAMAFAISPAYGQIGASVPLAMVLATIACAFIADCIGQMAIHIPSAGGMYTYISRSLGSKIGFLSAWAFMLGQPLLMPYVAYIWAQYVHDMVLEYVHLDVSWIIWVIVGCAILFALTYYGIKISTEASVIMGAIEILVLLGLGATMIFTNLSSNTVVPFTPGGNSWQAIFQGGVIFCFLTFLGFEAAAPLAEETSNPKKTISRAVILSAIGIGVVYVFATYAAAIGWGIPALDKYASDPAPWATMAGRYWGVAGPIVLSLVIINSAFGNGNSGINATSRVAYAMGRIGTLPKVFAKLSKHQTPIFGIAVHAVASAVIAIGFGLIFGTDKAPLLIGTLLTMGLLLLYIGCCVSVFFFYLRERRSELNILRHAILPIIPLAIVLWVFTAQIYPDPGYPINLAGPILGGWMVLGVIYLIYLMRKDPAALERGKEVFVD